MPVQDTTVDRVRALAGLSNAELAKVIALQPHLVAWTQGSGPIQHVLGTAPIRPDRRRLALVLANPETIHLTVTMLPVNALRMIIIAAAFDDRLTAAQIERELAPLSAEERASLIRILVERLLAEAVDGGIRLRPGVSDIVRSPGRTVQRLALDQSINSDLIGTWLGRLGAYPIPTRKTDRIESLAAVFANRPRMLELIRDLSPAARAMFDRLMDAGGTGISSGSLGVDIWQLRMRSAVLPRHLQSQAEHAPTAALRVLAELGLVWVEESTYRIGLWLDVITTVQTRMFLDWFPLPHVDHVALEAENAHAPAVLGSLHGLLRQVSAEPIVGLKSGGIGVKAVRDLSKRLGSDEPTTSLVLSMAFGAGLLGTTMEVVGKGRSESLINRFEVLADAVATWSELSVAEQWRRIIVEWFEGNDAEPEGYLMVSTVRRQLIADLLAIPAGFGVPSSEVEAHVNALHLGVGGDAKRFIGELQVLGLIPDSGPVGLTALARVLITDPAALEEHLGAQSDTFVVQADLTVIAPPTLDPTVRARLDQLCTIESSGSVTVLRLDRTRIAAELAAGNTAALLTEFLHAHSSVPVAAVVDQTILDTERQRGGLTVSTAATVVTADDVLGLAAAVKVKAARLTLIAPTVAISDLPLAKVVAALRAKGLAPASASSGAGYTGDASGRGSRPPPRRASAATKKPSRLAGALHPTVEQLEQLVETW